MGHEAAFRRMPWPRPSSATSSAGAARQAAASSAIDGLASRGALAADLLAALMTRVARLEERLQRGEVIVAAPSRADRRTSRGCSVACGCCGGAAAGLASGVCGLSSWLMAGCGDGLRRERVAAAFSGGAASDAAGDDGYGGHGQAVAVHLTAARARAPATVACDVPSLPAHRPRAPSHHVPRQRCRPLSRRLRGDQPPIRIGARLRRRDVAAERPDVGHFLDASADRR